ncbi:MAG: glucose 1-dehydrogenase [Candidatus Bathyarchaeota archaeon]|nr:glucose 1-dehydrogenase [Candidatus Bathyarchaeota archaeon]
MPRNRFDLAGKVAIVTGGGRGIGKAIAVGLAEHGADVVLSSRTQTQIEQVAQEIRNLGRKALPIVVDLTKMSDLDRLIDGTINAFQHIDVLVNNAGQSHEMPAELVEEKEWDSTMSVNVKAPFFLSQKVGKVMIRQGKGGSIINITSEVVQKVELNVGPYCPSKAALHSVTKILAKEWGKYNIRVNSLAPCFVETELNSPFFAQKEWYESKLKLVPLGRHSVPDDLVGAAVFLASDASSYITGTTILVDGGLTA